jgi:hypothetical protein
VAGFGRFFLFLLSAASLASDCKDFFFVIGTCCSEMAGLFDLDGLVGGHRANAFESRVQHRPPAYGILSVMGIFHQLAVSCKRIRA